MNILGIFEIVAAIIATIFGGYEFVKLLMTRNSVKTAAKLENEKTIAEIERAKDDEMVNRWKEISMQHESDIAYYRSIIAERDDQVAILNNTITDLREKLDDTRSELVRAQLLRCTVLSCSSRKPPLGYTENTIEKVYEEVE